MKLTAEIDGASHALHIQRDGARLVAEISESPDGVARRYELEARETEAGMYLLLMAGRVYECRARRADAQGGAIRVQVGQTFYDVTLIDPRRLRNTQRQTAQASGRAQIEASMPGKIVRVLVDVGARVEAGDGLIVVEAMKMQNELKSPKSGIVVELRTRVGTTVNAGEVLLVVE